MKQKDLINLLNRAAAGYETPSDLEGDEMRHLIDDLSIAAGHFSGDTELSNLLSRAAAGLETPADLNESDIKSLIEDLVVRAKSFYLDRNDEDDKVFNEMHRNKDRFTIQRAGEAFSNLVGGKKD